MQGAFSKFYANWPSSILHNDRNDPEKIRRYKIGNRRLEILKNHSIFFGSAEEGETRYVAFINPLEEDDLIGGMPDWVRVEYLCGKEVHNRFMFFSYIWFCCNDSVTEYAKRHGLRV